MVSNQFGMSMDTFSKAESLKKRLWFTLIALIIYRIGSFIPIPGVDASVLTSMFSGQNSGILGMFDMFTGGALSRMAILALNIMPYISASIIMQLLSAVSPELKALRDSGTVGAQKINQYTRYLTVIICVVQAYGIAAGLENMTSGGAAAVINPGFFFRFSTVVTLTGGAMFVVWLGDQITQRGVGQGTSLIIFAGIIANLPSALTKTADLGAVGQISPVGIVMLLAIAIGAIAAIAFFEQAERRVLVHYPKRGGAGMGAQQNSSYLPLKINTSDVIPPIFASSILLMPATIAQFASSGAGPEWLQVMLRHLQHGAPTYMIVYALLIVFFAFFYTAVVFNPEDTAENLKKSGGYIPGIRPGVQTAQHMDFILTRLTVLGAFYLVVLCLLPDFLIVKMSVPFYLGGTTLLIVCNVIMKTMAQIQSELIAYQYESVLKKVNKNKRFR